MSDRTDVWAVANNYVSVTPVHMEMTKVLRPRKNARKPVWKLT